MCNDEGCQEECRCHDDQCSCFKSMPLRGLLHLAILTVLKDEEMHGSNIHKKIGEAIGIQTIKPVIYTLLRRLEGDGLVISSWDMRGGGPARRVYRITEEGLDYLSGSVESLREVSKVLGRILDKNSSTAPDRSAGDER